MIDVDRMRAQWARLTESPGLDKVAATFYAWLIVANPDALALFPVGMAEQRAKLVGAIGAVVAEVDHLERARPVLEQLGRDHRRFGATGEHYAAVGSALLDTLEHHLGDDWTKDTAASWLEAYLAATDMMREAAGQAEADGIAPWWDVTPAWVAAASVKAIVCVYLPELLPRGYQMAQGDVMPASPGGRPGMWVAATVRDVGPEHFELSVKVDPTDPATLALLYLPEGAFVRLGVPHPLTAGGQDR